MVCCLGNLNDKNQNSSYIVLLNSLQGDYHYCYKDKNNVAILQPLPPFYF